jgi:nitroreductase
MPDETSDLFEAMMTQRAIRSIKPDPVPEELIMKAIELATKAPSGGNTQPWAFIIVRDKDQLAKLAEGVRESFAATYEMYKKRMKPGDPEPLQNLRGLVERFESLPVVIYPCAVLAEDADPTNLRYYASLFPAVQNLLLAARGLGIGAALTTQALEHAKGVLNLPKNVQPVAMIPFGYPDRDHYGPTTRKPVSEVVHWDTW